MQTTELQVRKADGLMAEGLLFGLWVGDVLVSTEYWLLRGGTLAVSAMQGVFRHPFALALGVVGILLAGSLSMGRYAQLEMAQAKTAKLDEMAIANAAELYRIEMGRWPARPEDLVPRYLRELHKDPWHRNYSLYRGDGGFAVVSAGPDGENGTPDDLITISPLRKE